MNQLWDIAWHRFNIIQGVVSDANARIISVLFYFTILVPFGVGYSLTSDPFLEKETVGEDGKKKPASQAWHDRESVSTDLEIARRQG